MDYLTSFPCGDQWNLIGLSVEWLSAKAMSFLVVCYILTVNKALYPFCANRCIHRLVCSTVQKLLLLLLLLSSFFAWERGTYRLIYSMEVQHIRQKHPGSRGGGALGPVLATSRVHPDRSIVSRRTNKQQQTVFHTHIYIFGDFRITSQPNPCDMMWACTHHTERPDSGFKRITFSLCSNSGNHCATVPP